MKGPHFFSVASATVISLISLSSHAALIGVLPATSGGTDWQAYYDDQLKITWAADANLLNGVDDWSTANAAAMSLNIGGVTGWRLPSMDVDGSGAPFLACDAPGITQAQCADNEYDHLYFYGAGTTLGAGITESSSSPFNSLGPFTAVISGAYWSETPGSTGQHRFYRFADASSGSSRHAVGSDTLNLYAWAVHDGNVAAVPVPAAVWLFGSGLIGLLGLARRKR